MPMMLASQLVALWLAMDVDTNPLADLVTLLLWVARIAILVIFGSIGCLKIAKGQADENPRERNEGFTFLGAAGVLFAATFAVALILS